MEGWETEKARTVWVLAIRYLVVNSGPLLDWQSPDGSRAANCPAREPWAGGRVRLSVRLGLGVLSVMGIFRQLPKTSTSEDDSRVGKAEKNKQRSKGFQTDPNHVGGSIRNRAESLPCLHEIGHQSD
jgi:hypothetical protein